MVTLVKHNKLFGIFSSFIAQKHRIIPFYKLKNFIKTKQCVYLLDATVYLQNNKIKRM